MPTSEDRARGRRSTGVSAKDFYDAYWLRDQYPDGSGVSAEVQRLLAWGATESTRCIDIGCGNGRATGPFLSRASASYVGVDISAAAVAQARELGLDVRLIDDACDLPFDDASFDLAVCIEVLEHLVRPDYALTEIARVLAPGGVLIASVPNILYWRSRADLATGRWHPRGDHLSVAEPWRDPHLRFFTPATLAAMFSRVGFTSVTVSPYGGGILRDVPILRKLAKRENSSLYRRLRARFPALLGAGVCCIAQKA